MCWKKNPCRRRWVRVPTLKGKKGRSKWLWGYPKTIKHFHSCSFLFATLVKKLEKDFGNPFVPGTCLSSILVVETSKTRSFPIKTRVIWVPGIYIYNYKLYSIYSYLNK